MRDQRDNLVRISRPDIRLGLTLDKSHEKHMVMIGKVWYNRFKSEYHHAMDGCSLRLAEVALILRYGPRTSGVSERR